MFDKMDFQGDAKMKIVCIVMNMLGKTPLMRFSQLLSKDKRLFNEKLNEYINHLPEEDWQTKINNDFMSMCNDEIFNETFLPEKCLVIQS